MGTKGHSQEKGHSWPCQRCGPDTTVETPGTEVGCLQGNTGLSVSTHAYTHGHSRAGPPSSKQGSERHKALTPVHRMADKLVYSCHWGFMSQISWSHYDCHLGRGSSPCPHCSWEPRPFGPELPGEVRTSALGSILRGGLCCQENTLTLMFFPSASKPHTRHLMPFL